MGTEGIFLLRIYLVEGQAINKPTKLKMMIFLIESDSRSMLQIKRQTRKKHRIEA